MIYTNDNKRYKQNSTRKVILRKEGKQENILLITATHLQQIKRNVST